jgi:hypothetical protein
MYNIKVDQERAAAQRWMRQAEAAQQAAAATQRGAGGKLTMMRQT